MECSKVESIENVSAKHSVHSDKHSNRSRHDSLKASLSSRSNDIDERYLSQSFQPPAEVVAIGNTQTEASYFNQWSSRKHTSRNSNNKKASYSNDARYIVCFYNFFLEKLFRKCLDKVSSKLSSPLYFFEESYKL